MGHCFDDNSNYNENGAEQVASLSHTIWHDEGFEVQEVGYLIINHTMDGGTYYLLISTFLNKID